MANKKLSEGVGKKIVEALKKQSEIEINPLGSNENQDDFESLSEELNNAFGSEDLEEQEAFEDHTFQSAQTEDLDSTESIINETYTAPESTISYSEPVNKMPSQPQPFINYQQAAIPQDSFINELDSFEIPSNIAVLKKLIAQLPSGVTRHTGAQIIKQTMEALGISMKSVLQEAQQVQDGLNNSAKECYATIQEYKKQIMVLEKQSQSHQKQYAALNELISLFVQTGV